MQNGHAVIMGAGPAGLSAAYELKKLSKIPITIIEKCEKVGGLSKTLQFGDFKTDIGPHRFYSKNEDLYCLLRNWVGNNLITVNRLTRFYVDGKFFNYPLDSMPFS